MEIENIFFWMCAVMAVLFTYGKYFVAVTELTKAYYGITAMLWLILGFILCYSLKILNKLEKK